MERNIRSSRRGPPSPPGPSRYGSRTGVPLPNPSLTSTWGHRIGSLQIPHSQNVNNPVAGGSNVNIYVNPGPTDTQTTNQEHLDDLIVTARADHEIYSTQLLTKKRGYPLWVPGPGMQLPIEYRRQGISIGDVGIITSTGEFDFLFNIFLPSDHPINDGMVPPGFQPLPRQGLERHIQRTVVYGPNTHLASASVRKISADSISESSIDHRFESAAKEAAILVIPDGATTQNLLNTKGVRSIISSNAKHWYTYVTETCGREVENGDIRVVVGIDKVPSWGIATSSCSIGQTASYVFKQDPTYTYTWDCTGGSGRVGPLEAETRHLVEDSDNAVLENQCIFVRTVNFTLSGKVWNDFPSEVVQQPVQGSGKSARRGSAFNRRGSRGRHNNSARGNGSSGHQPGSTQGSSHCVQPVDFDPVELGVNHPSATLHNRLHEKFPDANMVITEDMDWISVLNDDDVVFPEPEDLCARTLETHDALNTQGIINLLRKHGDQLRPRSFSPSGQSGSAENTEDRENFGAHDPLKADKNEGYPQTHTIKSPSSWVPHILRRPQRYIMEMLKPEVSVTKRVLNILPQDVFQGPVNGNIGHAHNGGNVIAYNSQTVYTGNAEGDIEPSQTPRPKRRTRTEEEDASEDDSDCSNDNGSGGAVFHWHGAISGLVEAESGSGNVIAMKEVPYIGNRENSLSKNAVQTRVTPRDEREIMESRNTIRDSNREPVKIGANYFPSTTERQQAQNRAETYFDTEALTKEIQNISPEMQRFINSLARQGPSSMEDER